MFKKTNVILAVSAILAATTSSAYAGTESDIRSIASGRTTQSNHSKLERDIQEISANRSTGGAARTSNVLSVSNNGLELKPSKTALVSAPRKVKIPKHSRRWQTKVYNWSSKKTKTLPGYVPPKNH